MLRDLKICEMHSHTIYLFVTTFTASVSAFSVSLRQKSLHVAMNYSEITGKPNLKEIPFEMILKLKVLVFCYQINVITKF